jgi:Uma2 family endonuclease
MEARVPVMADGKTTWTIGEYLERESTTGQRHEHFKGEIFAVPGTKFIHNIIAVNLLGSLVVRVRNQPCQSFGGDQRIHIPTNTLFTYPDISVVCEEPVIFDNETRSVLNPSILVEVLSASTRYYDRGLKFELCKDIPSLKEYVLVESETIGTEVWRSNGKGQWNPEENKNISESLYLRSLDLHLALSEIYEGTYLAAN